MRPELARCVHCIRPDVAASVCVLSSFYNFPGAMHVRACKRVAMCFYNTRRYGITYRRAEEHKSVPLMYAGAQHPLSNGTNLLQVFADSDYAGDETRRSTRLVKLKLMQLFMQRKMSCMFPVC